MCSDCYASCGGTIVGKKWIVTAAHCFEDMKPLRPETVYVEAGVVNQDDGSDFKQTFRCIKIHMHPKYDIAERFDLDVAVLELDKEIIYNDYVRPLCLNEEELKVGQECTVTGFGKTAENGDSSVYLKQALMPIVSWDTCKQVMIDTLNLSIPTHTPTPTLFGCSQSHVFLHYTGVWLWLHRQHDMRWLSPRWY